MKLRWQQYVWPALAAAGLVLPAAPSAATPERALCHVCRVHEGATHDEPVKATRTHDGIEYGFCSQHCAETFDADPAAYRPPTFPWPAPRFAWTTLAGAPVSSDSLRGRVVLLDFWATWCAPCRKSMPELQGLHQRYAGRGLTIVGVSIDEGDPAKVRDWVRSKKLDYPIVIDSARAPAWEAFRVKTIPAAYLIDREGGVVAQWTGRPADIPELERRLEQMLARD